MLVNVYIGDLEVLFKDSAKYEEYLSELSEERKKKTLKIKSYEGRCRSIGAGVLLDEALKQYSLREKDMTYGYGEVGKPYFKEAPELYFNLSHSRSRAMCVIGDIPVGCDIEFIKKANEGIAKRFFSAKDNELLKSAKRLGEPEYRESFYTLWTLKESYIKCTGLGLKCPMDSFSFIYDIEKYHIDGNADYSFLSDIERSNSDIKDGYAYSVCVNNNELPELKIRNIVL
jgi:4'-phosphopantetheinyl transferase